MSETVHASVDDGICTLRIENSGKRNALSPTVLEDLIAEIEAVEGRDDVRVLVLTGTGEQAFSAGYDISALDDESRAGNAVGFAAGVEAVFEFEYPTIAMINGDTFGGAVELAAVCDLRIAVEGARFAITPAKLGLIYGDRGINHVMHHVGPANTKELLFTGEPIDAERARSIGFLNDVVERPALEERTYGIAETIAGNAPKSLVGMKRIVRALEEKRTLSEAEKEWVDRLRAEAARSDDHAEGLEAFAEGRKPEFEGR